MVSIMGSQKLIQHQDEKKLFTLPKLPGVSALSLAEIMEDLREVQKFTPPADTDSDASTQSEDIPDSRYPVKPRKTLKIPSREGEENSSARSGYSTMSSDYGGFDVEEAFEMLKEIGKNNPNLLKNEKTREEYESTCKSFEFALETSKDKFNPLRTREENYIRLLQGISIRSLALRQSLSHKNSMLLRMHHLISNIKSATLLLEAEKSKIKQALNSKVKRGKPDPPKMLRIHLQQSNKDAYLFPGQLISTPMGEGTITGIDTSKQKVIIKLTDGQLYSSIGHVVGWMISSSNSSCSSGLIVPHNLCSDLQNHWKNYLNDSICLEAHHLRTIQDLLESSTSEEEDEPATDNDDGSAEGENGEVVSNPSDEEPVNEETLTTGAFSETIVEGEIPGEEEGNGTSVKLETTSNSSSTSNHKTSNVGKNGKQPALSSSSYETESNVSAFPLKVNPMEAPSRATAAEYLKNKRLENLYDGIPDNFLPYCFFPPGKLSSLVTCSDPFYSKAHGITLKDQPVNTEQKEENPILTEEDLNEVKNKIKVFSEDSILYDETALNSCVLEGISTGSMHDCAVARIGTTGSHAWDGETSDLRSSLKALGDQISALEKTKFGTMKELESLRMESAKHSEETACLRLRMFTRRISHRNNLSNHGIVAPVAPTNGKGNLGKGGAKSSLVANSVPSLSSTVHSVAGDLAGTVEMQVETLATLKKKSANLQSMGMSRRRVKKGSSDATSVVSDDPLTRSSANSFVRNNFDRKRGRDTGKEETSVDVETAISRRKITQVESAAEPEVESNNDEVKRKPAKRTRR